MQLVLRCTLATVLLGTEKKGAEVNAAGTKREKHLTIITVNRYTIWIGKLGSRRLQKQVATAIAPEELSSMELGVIQISLKEKLLSKTVDMPVSRSRIVVQGRADTIIGLTERATGIYTTRY